MTTGLTHSTGALEIINALRRCGLGDGDIAYATGATNRTITDWRLTGRVPRRAQRRLDEMRELVLLLDEVLTRRGIGQWFGARTRLLDGQSPLDALAAGDHDSARVAAEALRRVAYV